MLSWLKADKSPFLLATLFGLIGWTVKHLVDRTLESPIIEYRTDKERRGDDSTVIYYTIQNLSNKTQFKDLNFLILQSDTVTTKVLNGIPLFPPPLVNEGRKNSSFECYPRYYRFNLSQLNPYAIFQIRIIQSGDEVADLRISSGSEVRLVEKSFETFLVRNEMSILLLLLGTWVLLTLVYFINIKI